MRDTLLWSSSLYSRMIHPMTVNDGECVEVVDIYQNRKLTQLSKGIAPLFDFYLTAKHIFC